MTDLLARVSPCWLFCRGKLTETFFFLELLWGHLRPASLALLEKRAWTSCNTKHGQQLMARPKHLSIHSRHRDQSPPPRHYHLRLLLPRYRWRRVYRQPREQPKIPGRRLLLSGPGLEENLEDQNSFFFINRGTRKAITALTH